MVSKWCEGISSTHSMMFLFLGMKIIFAGFGSLIFAEANMLIIFPWPHCPWVLKAGAPADGSAPIFLFPAKSRPQGRAVSEHRISARNAFRRRTVLPLVTKGVQNQPLKEEIWINGVTPGSCISIFPFGRGSKFNRRFWSMFLLARIPFWYRLFEPQPFNHGEDLGYPHPPSVRGDAPPVLGASQAQGRWSLWTASLSRRGGRC